MMQFPRPAISFHPTEANNPDALFSILIPSWNNLELLQLCVRSIRENSAYSHQIIIHINEGTDGSLDWVKSENLDFSFSPQNSGVCYSINAMATLATTDHLLYLNDDMYVCKGWDEALWKVASGFKHKNWYLSGTMIEPLKSKSNCVASPHNFGRNPSDFLREELDSFASRLKRRDWFGASWPPSLVPKELFFKVGGYSEEFSPGMYSDPDFSMKLWKAGVREFRGIGSSLVYHFMSRSTGRVKKNNGRKQFAMKWGVTSSFFYKNLLQMGRPFREGKKLSSPAGILWLPARLKALWIRIR
jgi:GT2 family glycosyltransferase